MNSNINWLVSIASKETRTIIGLMSGTSLDGLDVALCHVSGSGLQTRLELKQFCTVAYDDTFKAQVKQIFSKRNIDLEQLCLLNEHIGLTHASMINDCLKRWNIANADIDLIASHGQTIYHAPSSLHKQKGFTNATLQIGDADHIAVNTGIITIADFRQKHIAAGGEGAPLAVYGDHILFGKKGEDRILLNIGGISNLTYLPANRNFAAVTCSDIGPGNTLMDAFVQKHFPGKYFDKNAEIATTGSCNNSLLQALKENSFFDTTLPKTTGPELFNMQYIETALKKSGTEKLPVQDILHTLTKFTADSITDIVKKYWADKTDLKIYCSGGGMHNPLLMQYISQQLPGTFISTTKELGIDPDAKEAVLFAILANESICGNPELFSSGNKNTPTVCMGKISFFS